MEMQEATSVLAGQPRQLCSMLNNSGLQPADYIRADKAGWGECVSSLRMHGLQADPVLLCGAESGYLALLGLVPTGAQFSSNKNGSRREAPIVERLSSSGVSSLVITTSHKVSLVQTTLKGTTAYTYQANAQLLRELCGWP